MLSEETQFIICKLLKTLANNEIEIEAARSNLNNHPQFEPYSIFKRIDIEQKNILSDYNIVSFLQENSIFCSIKEAQDIIQFYDSDKTYTLSYSQFLNLILTEGLFPKRNVIKKLNYPSHIPYSLEFLVCRILEKELNLVREINDIKNELNKHKDFSVYDMFQIIKTNTSSISTEAIGLFLIANNFQLNDNELKIIVKKLDIDKNGYVTIEDLEMFFGNKERYFGDDSTLLPKKQILQTEEISINSNYKSLKNGQTNFSNNKNDNNSHINIEQISPNLAMRSYPERQSEIGKPFYPYKENPFSNTNPCPKSNPFLNITNLPHYSNIELITSYLKLLMDIELKIENLKIELAIRADFNIEDAFRLFEHTNPNFITEPDLKKGLNILRIYPKSEEILLLMNKYSLSGQNVLNFSDLFDMLTPFTREYRSEIEHRKASPYSTKFNKDNIFLTTTKICIVNLFKFIIDAENLIEKERKKMNKIFNINIRTAFKMIDKSQCGAFSILDLNLFLKENGVSYIPKELNLLFIRLDRSREGKIGLKAFVTETFPKLPN